MLTRDILVILFTGLVISACAQNPAKNNNNVKEDEKTIVKTRVKTEKYKITFIELGSVRCIPCQKMQIVMKSIESKYAGIVKVEFHDVWTPEGKPFSEKYGIEAIPTQIFLDETGKEVFRHEGYFPEEDLVKFLKSKGVTE